jgi:hypothetical protein
MNGTPGQKRPETKNFVTGVLIPEEGCCYCVVQLGDEELASGD